MSGQVCENQQGICVLTTKYIVNRACLDYNFGNTSLGMSTGQICSEVSLPLVDPNCSALTTSSPVATSTGYKVNMSCQGHNTSASTPISIDCGNGMILSGFGSFIAGTCQYSGSYIGNAQCRVGNDTTNPSCRQPVAPNAGQCKALEARDGTVVIVNDDHQ